MSRRKHVFNSWEQKFSLTVIGVLHFANLVLFSNIWDVTERSPRQRKSDSLTYTFLLTLFFHNCMLSLSRPIPFAYFSGLCSFHCYFITRLITSCEVSLAQPRGEGEPVCWFPVWPAQLGGRGQHHPGLSSRRKRTTFRETAAAQVYWRIECRMMALLLPNAVIMNFSRPCTLPTPNPAIPPGSGCSATKEDCSAWLF